MVILNDDLRAIAEEIVRGGFLGRVHIGLDFFDASINRIAAWVIGMRAMIKALLLALLEPTAKLRELEAAATSPPGWRCSRRSRRSRWAPCGTTTALTQETPVGLAWLDEVKKYEANVMSKR